MNSLLFKDVKQRSNLWLGCGNIPIVIHSYPLSCYDAIFSALKMLHPRSFGLSKNSRPFDLSIVTCNIVLMVLLCSQCNRYYHKLLIKNNNNEFLSNNDQDGTMDE